ncbi:MULTISPECIES: bifunctional diguanylate cyclase/phosphodiesterase [Methylotenera]|uniref:bifunctional diguanylate cyclase/phosphodiesterase n=1 Tax=Methylotenera TaxID=359407 RepID=UPI000381B631|nr:MULTISPECIES: EAL domain-containing protein [Methylotenera]
MFTNIHSVIAKFVLVALAYVVTAKLGLMVPYKASIVTLMWLPTGIAVGAIMRWGNLSLPAIFSAATFIELSLGVPFISSLAIACTNTLAPFVTAALLNQFQFNRSLTRQRDIALIIAASAFGMLISATGGTFSLYNSGLISADNLQSTWSVWWIGDTVGALLALPLILNIHKASLRINTKQSYQFVAWLMIFALCEFMLAALVPSLNRKFMLSLFLIMPVLIWASMNFGIVGGSFVVIILSSVAVWFTSQGHGSFYSVYIDQGLFSLWIFMITLVVMMLLISVLQSERNLAENALRNNDTQLRAVINGALDGIVTIDESGALIEFNPAAERIFGYTKHEVIGKSLAEVMIPPALRQAHNEKHKQFVLTGKKHIFDRRVELNAMRADGTEFPVELTLTSLKNNGQTIVTGFIRDISLQKKALLEIEKFAYYDMLTGLPNRRLLLDRFQRAVVTSKRAKSYCALIFIDLDHFKLLNDTKGHDVGDHLLIEVAHRIQQTIREGDTVARLSGDEFIIIIENLDANESTAYQQVTEVAQKLLLELNKSYPLELFEFNTTASLGLTLFNSDELSFEDHLRHADTSMYQAKAAGRNTYRIYDQITQDNLERSFAIESALQEALKENAFYLHYQSIVDVNQQVISAEVLLRWKHPTLGNISPTEFIPIAEKNNQIIKIGYWVIQQTCEQLKKWENSPKLSKIRLSVNISAKQFLYINFIEELHDIIANTGATPDLLKLELTETAVIDNIDDVINKINILKTIGVRIALDDFGMGHSSLVYLKKLPVTQIKIDQSFVGDVLTDSNDAAIVQMILAIGKTIHCNIVAEGVEQLEQFEILKKFGCHFFQGYYFSKPIQLADFEKMVEAG